MDNDDPKPKPQPSGDRPPPRPPRHTAIGLGPDDDDPDKNKTARINLPPKAVAAETIKLATSLTQTAELEPLLGKRSKLYRRLFVLATALSVIGFFCLPLELDVYSDPAGMRDWMWNGSPPVSTETANYWHYYSLWPLWVIAVLTAIISLILLKSENRRGV